MNARLYDSLAWATCSLMRLPPRMPSPRSIRTGRPRPLRIPRGRRCLARWSAAPVAVCSSRSARTLPRAHTSPIAQHHQIGMQLLGRAPLLARFSRYHAQPVGGRPYKPIKLAGRRRNPELGLHRVDPQVLADGIADNPVLNLSDRYPLREMQRRITLNNAMSITPMPPDQQKHRTAINCGSNQSTTLGISYMIFPSFRFSVLSVISLSRFSLCEANTKASLLLMYSTSLS